MPIMFYQIKYISFLYLRLNITTLTFQEELKLNKTTQHPC